MKTEQKTVTLLAHGGDLYTSFDDIVDDLQKEWHTPGEARLAINPEAAKWPHPILMVRYDEGDCDTVPWPLRKKHHERLARALFDAREMGIIPDVRTVVLPDGSTFDIDANCK